MVSWLKACTTLADRGIPVLHFASHRKSISLTITIQFMMMAHNTLVVVLLVFTSVLLPSLAALPPTNFRVGSRAGGSAHGPQQQHSTKASPRPSLPRPSSPLLFPVPVVSLQRELTTDTTGTTDLSDATVLFVYGVCSFNGHNRSNGQVQGD